MEVADVAEEASKTGTTRDMVHTEATAKEAMEVVMMDTGVDTIITAAGAATEDMEAMIIQITATMVNTLTGIKLLRTVGVQ